MPKWSVLVVMGLVLAAVVAARVTHVRWLVLPALALILVSWVLAGLVLRAGGAAKGSAAPSAGVTSPTPGVTVSAGGQEAGRFPRRKWYPGYRVSEVDDFIARIEATLSRSASPGQIVTAADVRTVKLRSTRRGGYDQAVVDEALDRYAEELDRVMPEA